MNIAALSIRGLRVSGKTEEIERWMKAEEIHILCIQEARIQQNTRETRKEYTWYFSGENNRKHR